MAADEAHSKMHPAVAGFQTFFTTLRRRFNVFDQFSMATGFFQLLFLSFWSRCPCL